MAPNLSTLRAFTAGEVIIDTKPLVHVIDNKFIDKYCGNCVKPTDRLKKCSNCHQINYCDKKCQKNDWISHKNECKVFRHNNYKPMDNKWKERLLLRLWFAIKTDETFATKRHQLIDGSDVSLNDIEVKTKELSKNKDLMIEFEIIFNHFKSYGLEFERKELLHWFALLSTHLMAFLEYYPCYETIDYPLTLRYYIQLSSLSHSCVPNCALILTKDLRLEVRAMKSIAIGEELTVNYIDLCHNRSERQKQLKDNFIIECKCNKCVNNLDQYFNYSNHKEVMDKQVLYITGPAIDIKKSYDYAMEAITNLVSIYGEFHPLITEQLLIWYFLFKDKQRIVGKQAIKQLFSTLIKDMKITHGSDHQIYKSVMGL